MNYLDCEWNLDGDVTWTHRIRCTQFSRLKRGLAGCFGAGDWSQSKCSSLYGTKFSLMLHWLGAGVSSGCCLQPACSRAMVQSLGVLTPPDEQAQLKARWGGEAGRWGPTQPPMSQRIVPCRISNMEQHAVLQLPRFMSAPWMSQTRRKQTARNPVPRRSPRAVR